MTDCTTYNYDIKSLLVPSDAIFFKLCVSFDKTRLFLMSVLRIIVYCLIFYVLRLLNIAEWCTNSLIKKSIYSLFVVLIIINVIYLGIVILKRT